MRWLRVPSTGAAGSLVTTRIASILIDGCGNERWTAVSPAAETRTAEPLICACLLSNATLRAGRIVPTVTEEVIDKRSAKQFIRINDKIRAREVRVIDENGEQLGILVPFEALKIARERGLDLVEVSPSAVPPVCRIQDYGKFLYEKDKSDRAARKKQKIIVIKEVKFSVTVDEHDYQTKKNQAVRFLSEGDKVKASLRFRGRQMAHRDLGYNIINRLIQDIGDTGAVEFMPRMEGTTLHAILAPGKKILAEKEAAAKKAAPVVPRVQAPSARPASTTVQ